MEQLVKSSLFFEIKQIIFKHILIINNYLGELFAECIYNPDTNTVEPVRDSSRYFVLRLEHDGQRAFIGIGFRERSEAFDFQVALQGHVKYVLH